MCSIPPFDHNNVLPPHKGNPTSRTDISPYECSIMEFCKRFSTSQHRVGLLKGLVLFRLEMIKYGINNGFQWIDGSFSENIEKSEGRDPNDIDIVTFVNGYEKEQVTEILNNFIEFVDPTLSKVKYKLDHYSVDFAYGPLTTVELTKYWVQLFSHNRLGVWKGMIRLELNINEELDQEALNFLNSL